MRVLSRCEIDEISRLATTRGKVARGGSVDGELDDPILAASILLNDLTDAISVSVVAATIIGWMDMANFRTSSLAFTIML